MAAFGALASVASAVLVSGGTTASPPWALGVVAAAVITAGVWPQLRRHWRYRTGARVLAVALAAMLYLTRPLGDAASVTLAAALLGGVSLIGWTGRRRLVGFGIAGVAVLVAGAVYHRWMLAFPADHPGAALPWAGAGVAFAAVAALTQLPRHVMVSVDRVAREHRRAAASSCGEMRELIDRSLALWHRAGGFLPVGDANRALLEEAVLRLLEAATRWNEVEKHSQSVDADTLQQRCEQLESRAKSASDSMVRGQYEAAGAALAEQLRYLRDISQGRERVLARMHNYLAEMERFNLALANLKSTDASRETTDIQPMAAALADLGKDIDALGESLEA